MERVDNLVLFLILVTLLWVSSSFSQNSVKFSPPSSVPLQLCYRPKAVSLLTNESNTQTEGPLTPSLFICWITFRSVFYSVIVREASIFSRWKQKQRCVGKESLESTALNEITPSNPSSQSSGNPEDEGQKMFKSHRVSLSQLPKAHTNSETEAASTELTQACTKSFAYVS